MHSELPTDFQAYIHLSKYSRFDWVKGRRERWSETVDRWVDFFSDQLPKKTKWKGNPKVFKEVREAIYNLLVMPSMRGLMTAGPALERDNLALFNCTYTAVNRAAAFDEILYILMCGCGVGFSVERQYTNKLPTIADEFHPTDIVIVVKDSKLGWAKAFKELISLLYAGHLPQYDVSGVRKAGEPLMTFGGRASGPEPLVDLFKFAIELFKKAAGRKLTSLECHDLICKIADVVVVGGVRRSALISLSNLSDDRMRSAKSGQWWEIHPHRRLANNSAAYTEKPDVGIFMDEWKALYESKSGERGIFSRYGAKKKIAGLTDVTRDASYDFGVNPCGEIILRGATESGENCGGGVCNLSSVTVRPHDTLEMLKEKVRIATIIGTWQSAFTEFRYVSKKWKQNADEERLLGVSLNGIMDNPLLNGTSDFGALQTYLLELRAVAVRTNKEWAAKLGIPESAAITCVKPEGTTSSLVNTASGIHARYARYYVRRVRQDMKDPLTQFMIDAGIPHEPDVMKPHDTMVFSFPIEAPAESIFRNEFSALDMMNLWEVYSEAWCHHNPSITIDVKEEEWMRVGARVYDNFDSITGMSFLPWSDHIYKQAPYEAISEVEYLAALAKMPQNIDWSKIAEYESTDLTTGVQALACVAGGCEV